MQAYNERWAQQLEAPVSIDAYAAQAADFKVRPPSADSSMSARRVNILHYNTPQGLCWFLPARASRLTPQARAGAAANLMTITSLYSSLSHRMSYSQS